MSDLSRPPFREVKLMPVDLDVERRPDGAILIQSRIPLRPYDANLTKVMLQLCARLGDKPALAKRAPGGGDWQFTSYGDLGRGIGSAAQWLLRHAPPGRPLMIASDNRPAVAILSFAAWAIGLPVCPVSVSYAALGGDFGRLRHVIAKTNPAVIFAADGALLAPALHALKVEGVTLISDKEGVAGWTPMAELLESSVSDEVIAEIARRRPQDLALYMLTSGSTGLPKIVPLTFDNIMANTAQGLQALGESAGWQDVMLDWLPWHHAAGASVLRATLLEGGTLYIDDGKPVAGLFDQSIRNMREISVAYINNVPAGYGLLTEALDHDQQLRKTFFAKMHLMLYGGAGLPQHLYERLQAHAVAETGHRIMMTSGYGATETVSGFMAIYFESDRVGIGLPLPGSQIKLVPYDERYEVRAKGANITSGYHDDPVNTARAFDEEGFYKLGDLAIFHDKDDVRRGLAYAGRLAEEFKLAQGTWVFGGQVRDQLLKALSPLVTDLVLCDDNRPFLSVMLWPSPQGVTSTLGQACDIAGPALRAALAERLQTFNRNHAGASVTVKRALVLTEPPSVNAHEVSDKGSINRRVVLDRRADLVERLYAPSPDAAVIVPG